MSTSPHSYDPATIPVAATNRCTVEDPSITQRLQGKIPFDATITVASTTVTIQFLDGKGRPHKGRVFFTMIQTEVSPATSVPALASTGRLPAVGANTNGSTLVAHTANKVISCVTDADGLWVGTLTGALGTDDTIGVAPYIGIWFGT